MIVDASVVVPWFVQTEFAKAARPYRALTSLAAPSFVLIETAQILTKYVRSKKLEADKVQQSLDEIRLLLNPLRPTEELLAEAVNIALQTKHSVYDCLYLALALQTRDALVTADKRLAVAATSLAIDTHLIQAEAHP